MKQPAELGHRARKKEQTRRRIAECASTLFAGHGYEAVSMTEVARAADVSEQTVYNYFPSKQALVLDRAEQIRELYSRVVRERGGASPAAVLEAVVLQDVERYRAGDLDKARGEFLAQCVENPALRRYALEERERQTHVIAEAISATDPGVSEMLARAYAAALIAVVQAIHDRIGTSVLDRRAQGRTAASLRAATSHAFAEIEHAFTPRPATRRRTTRSTS